MVIFVSWPLKLGLIVLFKNIFVLQLKTDQWPILGLWSTQQLQTECVSFYYQYILSRNIQYISHTQKKAYRAALALEDHGEEMCDSSISILPPLFVINVFSSLPSFTSSDRPPSLCHESFCCNRERGGTRRKVRKDVTGIVRTEEQ